MEDKIPFYKASKPEKFQIFKMAMLGMILSIAAIALSFMLADETLSPNLNGFILISAGTLGFCTGLGWYDGKYTSLRVAGALIGLVYGLTIALVYLDVELLIKTPLAIIVGALFSGFGCFLVWIHPQAYSE